MRKLTLILLATLCLACSKNNDKDDTPKTPEEMILGEWKMTHSGSAGTAKASLYPVYRKNGSSYPYLTINNNGTLIYFNKGGASTPLVEGGGSYTLTGKTLTLNLYWAQYNVTVIHKYKVVQLSADELIVYLFYTYRKNDNSEYDTSYNKYYYRYSRNNPSENDTSFLIDLVTN